MFASRHQLVAYFTGRARLSLDTFAWLTWRNDDLQDDDDDDDGSCVHVIELHCPRRPAEVAEVAHHVGCRRPPNGDESSKFFVSAGEDDEDDQDDENDQDDEDDEAKERKKELPLSGSARTATELRESAATLPVRLSHISPIIHHAKEPTTGPLIASKWRQLRTLFTCPEARNDYYYHRPVQAR